MIQVLKSKSAIKQARRELCRRGLSCINRWPVKYYRRLAFRLGFSRNVCVGDKIKSWDVLRTAEFIKEKLLPDAPVLDIGAYASEILCVLYRMRYSVLSGVDLNPGIQYMPNAKVIEYAVSDFMHTPFRDESFAAITAISVIEHGLKSVDLLREVSRLLRPSGYFIASFDYWPEKINTTGVNIFGMDWKIFSKAEVEAFVVEARSYGLRLCGAVDFDAVEQVVKWGGRDYTFAWLALQKMPHNLSRKP